MPVGTRGLQLRLRLVDVGDDERHHLAVAAPDLASNSTITAHDEMLLQPLHTAVHTSPLPPKL
jgi:hypothetical protein